MNPFYIIEVRYNQNTTWHEVFDKQTNNTIEFPDQMSAVTFTKTDDFKMMFAFANDIRITKKEVVQELGVKQ